MRLRFTIVCLSVLSFSASVDMRAQETTQPVGFLSADHGTLDIHLVRAQSHEVVVIVTISEISDPEGVRVGL